MTGAELDNFFILVSRITVATMIVPIIVAIRYKNYLVRPLRVFFFYLVAILASNLLEQAFIWYANAYYDDIKHILKQLGISSTNFLAILYQLSNIALLGWFFFLLFPAKYGIWIKRISIFLFFAFIINYLFIEGHQVYGKFNPNATTIFTFSLAFMYLWKVYRSHLALPLTKNPYFWLSFGLIIPYLGSFFLSMVGEVSHEENYLLFITMSFVNNFFLVMSHILFAIGFWRSPYAKFIPLPAQDPVP